jgi:hypothetical protein
MLTPEKYNIENVEKVTFACLIILNISNFLFCKYCLTLAIVTVFRYVVFFKLQTELHKFRQIDNIFNTGVFVFIFFEIAWAWLQPYPFLEGKDILIPDMAVVSNYKWLIFEMDYQINFLLLVPVFMRCYIIYRFFISLSFYYDERADRIT